MLVVVKDGNIANLFESSFHFKATRGGDVFEIDSAKARRYIVYRGYDFVHVLSFKADRNCVYVGKFFEQNALAFHNGHTRFRAYVAESQNGRTVRYHCDSVPFASERITQFIISLDCEARGGNSRCVGKSQVLLVLHFGAGYDFEFALPLEMLFKDSSE